MTFSVLNSFSLVTKECILLLCRRYLHQQSCFLLSGDLKESGYQYWLLRNLKWKNQHSHSGTFWSPYCISNGYHTSQRENQIQQFWKHDYIFLGCVFGILALVCVHNTHMNSMACFWKYVVIRLKNI